MHTSKYLLWLQVQGGRDDTRTIKCPYNILIYVELSENVRASVDQEEKQMSSNHKIGSSSPGSSFYRSKHLWPRH